MSNPVRMVKLVQQAEYRDQAEANIERPGDASIVVRGRPRSIVMACPDGCGETLVINLDARAGKAWRHDMRGGGLTLFPSVWRDGGCESHFIIWRGHVVWCDRFQDGNSEPQYDQALEPLVLGAMDSVAARSAVEMAESLDQIVWDVNRVAGRLVQRGLARTWNADSSGVFVRTV